LPRGAPCVVSILSISFEMSESNTLAFRDILCFFSASSYKKVVIYIITMCTLKPQCPLGIVNNLIVFERNTKP
jgi:predicted glycosyltransferase involved in capsule biosynthesis